MRESTERLGIGKRTAATVTAVVALAAVVVGPLMAPPQASALGTGLETLGEIPLPPSCTVDPGKADIIPVAVDTDARRLYVSHSCNGRRFAIYDISTEIPTFVRESEQINSTIRIWNSNTVQFDYDRGRIYVLGLTALQEGENSQIVIFDLDTLEQVDSWRMETQAPGFAAFGFTYDVDRDRIYLVGAFHGGSLLSALQSQAGPGTVPRTAVVAIDAESGGRIWVNPLPSCDEPINSQKHGSLITMSAQRPMLYGFCIGGAPGHQRVGQAGIIRLNVEDQEGKTGITDFPSEFFPVSGDYATDGMDLDTGGVVALDRHSERFVAQSLSERTHGAWVFDGLRSSWIGFVAADDNTNYYSGLDPVSGKYYMGGGSGWLTITDVRATPVPQGRLFDEIRSSSPWARDVEGSLGLHSNIVADPATGRLFVKYLEGDVRGSLVLRDSTPVITPRTPTDLDDLTHDLPIEEAQLEFSANTSGFGAQYVQVGGWENVYTRFNNPSNPAWAFVELVNDIFVGADLAPENPADLRYGSRGATMSLVEGVGIDQSGASASAIATKPDDHTPGDAATKQNDAETQANEATGGGFDDLSEAVDDASSDDDGSDDEEVEQARYVTCLDGADDGEALRDEQGSENEPAHAQVVCDLTDLKTTARARFSGGSGGGGVIVSDSSFDGKTYRDPERGIVTEAEAVAEGIFFGEVDLGGFSIDRVTSTATTWAHGLDGTSHVQWVRTVEGMRTIGADGSVGEPTSCTTIVESGKDPVEEGDADCHGLQEDLNELMPNRFEVRFPLPEVVATPGGAFASVQENETDFLSGQATSKDERRMVPGMEMTVFADGPQRGRLWVQLAAVKADATFIRFPPPPEYDPGEVREGQTTEGPIGEPSVNEPTGPDEDSSGVDNVAIPVPGDEAVPPPEVDSPPTDPVSHRETFVGAFGWLPTLRSAGDAALTGALYVLFLLPAAEVVRRRRLLDVLTDTPATDATQALAKPPVAVSASPVQSTS